MKGEGEKNYMVSVVSKETITSGGDILIPGLELLFAALNGAQEEKGRTLLHIATREGRDDVV